MRERGCRPIRRASTALRRWVLCQELNRMGTRSVITTPKTAPRPLTRRGSKPLFSQWEGSPPLEVVHECQPRQAREVSRRTGKALVKYDHSSRQGALHNVIVRVTEKQALAVWCPTCGAKPGEKCELSSGQPRTDPHRDRRLVASDK